MHSPSKSSSELESEHVGYSDPHGSHPDELVLRYAETQGVVSRAMIVMYVFEFESTNIRFV